MGQLRRFFALKEEHIGDSFAIVSSYNHIAKVLRARVGERFVINIENELIDYVCEVTNIDKSTVYLNIVSSNINYCESKLDITLFCGCLKGGNMDLVVQKAVELGVNYIKPFESQFTISCVDNDKANRLTKISHEASKQCCRAKQVGVEPSINFNALCSLLPNYDAVIFCNENGGEKLLSLDLSCANRIAVVVGSEGGFSQQEQDILGKISISISLGKRILRAETATFYILSVLNELAETTFRG
ncbi:MAG: 16S rRNA (uracil(1498)-N(3))-methyltransferase [Clostridia bacterium]